MITREQFNAHVQMLKAATAEPNPESSIDAVGNFVWELIDAQQRQAAALEKLVEVTRLGAAYPRRGDRPES